MVKMGVYGFYLVLPSSSGGRKASMDVNRRERRIVKASMPGTP